MDSEDIEENDPLLTSSSHAYNDKDGNARRITVMILLIAYGQPLTTVWTGYLQNSTENLQSYSHSDYQSKFLREETR